MKWLLTHVQLKDLQGIIGNSEVKTSDRVDIAQMMNISVELLHNWYKHKLAAITKLGGKVRPFG